MGRFLALTCLVLLFPADVLAGETAGAPEALLAPLVGHPALELDVDCLSAGAVVVDLVYAPLETPLLHSARVRGLRVVDGLGMLLHQAVGGFARWFGVRPQVTEALRALVEADLISK